MSRAKVALYLTLIFLAGAIAGGAVVLSTPETFGMRGHHRPSHGSPEDFANRLWDGMKERLKLSAEQARTIEPIFRTGFAEVRSIQERSIEEVDAAIRRNQEEIATHLNDEQRAEMQKMQQERRNFMIKRGKPGDAPSTNQPPKS